MPRRQKVPLRRLTGGEREMLEQIARASRERADRVARAKMLLAVADGARFTDAAKVAGRRSGDAVARLVARWNDEGVAALEPRYVRYSDRAAAITDEYAVATVERESATLTLPDGPVPPVESVPILAGDGFRWFSGPVVRSADLHATLQHAMQIEGSLAIVLVDLESGMVLSSVERAGFAGFDLDVAAAGNTEVVRAKLATIRDLRLTTGIEDILITLTAQYHLIRPLGSDPGVFLYLVLDRAAAQLGLARRGLSQIEARLVI